jgi:ankyrin repeat protein
MRELIGLKADLDLAIGNKTPLHAAYFGRNPKTMELLIDEGANVNGTSVSGKDATGASGKDTKGASGNTVLHYASLDGRKDVVDLLLARNADINAQNSNGWTPLHRAALRGHVEVAKSLLKEVARRLKENEDEPGQLHQDDVLNSRSRNNNTPLHVAAIAGKLKVVNLLLDEKAKTDIYGEHGWTPAQAAEANRHEGIVRLLGSSDLRRFVSKLPSTLRQFSHVPF